MSTSLRTSLPTARAAVPSVPGTGTRCPVVFAPSLWTPSLRSRRPTRATPPGRPRARSPFTLPCGQSPGSAGKKAISPLWLCISISAMAAALPKLASIWKTEVRYPFARRHARLAMCIVDIVEQVAIQAMVHQRLQTTPMPCRRPGISPTGQLSMPCPQPVNAPASLKANSSRRSSDLRAAAASSGVVRGVIWLPG